MKGTTATVMALCGMAAMLGCTSVPKRVLELPQGPDNPRNSEGDFARLKDGRIIFIYSRYVGNSSSDHAPAFLASRESADGGQTWTDTDRRVLENEGGMNVMSVSLLRLQDGRLAMFYLRKNSTQDCRPVMRVSTDEAKTWSEPVMCVSDADRDYYVLNNARAIQLTSGRIVLPICRHAWLQDPGSTNVWKSKKGAKGGNDSDGEIMAALSDDAGATWRLSRSRFKTFAPNGKYRVTTQEPGVVELKDGRLLMWMRTAQNMQYVSYSEDGGDTWSKAVPWNLISPNSPATVRRLSNGDLIAIWNDHGAHPEYKDPDKVSPTYKRSAQWGNGQRAPLTVAISKDEGRTWICRRDLEGGPDIWACYIACLEVEDGVLLGYCADNALRHSRVTYVPLSWLYGPPREGDTSGFFKD
ncbi:MAG: exo-alpha-sialidase [Kiritimatiellae bacterium]|nr:exo-alpha-sialidase [Kiritimatiellia bacterium]